MDLDGPCVSGDDPIGDVETEAESLGPALLPAWALERIEDPRQQIGIDGGAEVVHAHADVCVQERDFHENGTGRIAVSNGVAEQMGDDLFPSIAVHPHRARNGVELDRTARVSGARFVHDPRG